MFAKQITIENVSPPVQKQPSKPKPEIVKKDPEPTSPVSAGMFENDDDSQDPRNLGSTLETQVGVNLEEAGNRVKTGTFKPLTTPKGQ